LKTEPVAIRDLVDELHPQDVSECLKDLDDEATSRALKTMPVDFAAQVFERLEEERQVSIAKVLGVNSTVRLVTEMSADETVDFFAALPADTVSKLLSRLQTIDPEQAEDVRELTRWPDECAGGLMNNEFVEVADEKTVDEVINILRLRAADGYEVLSVVYVLDKSEHVVGFVTLRGLLVAKPDATMGQILQHNLVSVRPEMDQEEVARVFARYDMHAIPVIDADRHILGIITSDDVIDVFEEEAEEDAQKMGAIEPIAHNYFSIPFFEYLSKRAPWLMILFVGGFFTTSAMETFEPVLQAVTQLAYYVPLLISAGGNSGSQSATLIIRGLAVGEIETADWFRVMRREFAQGITLGLLLATMGIGRAWLGGDGMDMGLLIGITIISIVTIGCVVGAMMPLLLSKLGLDPATSSTPFIATLVDVLGIVVYLGLAMWILDEANAAMLAGAG
jgi:magnesium transporter